MQQLKQHARAAATSGRRPSRGLLRCQAVFTPRLPSLPGSPVYLNGKNNAVGLAPQQPVHNNINIAVPEYTSSVTPPSITWTERFVGMGVAKANMPAAQTLLAGILAGAYISFAGALMFCVGGTIPGLAASNPGLAKLLCALVFPCGLMLVTLAGAELYTGNTATLPAAVYEGKATVHQLLRNWSLSFAGNFIGCLAMVGLVHATGVLSMNALPASVAVAKTSLPMGVAFARSIVANWLVCLAVLMATASNTVPGKIMALWPPIFAFVAMGMEHSIANMFLIPMGMVLGAKVSVGDFLINNLLPVTLGNTVAGAVFVAGFYTAVYGSWLKPKNAAA